MTVLDHDVVADQLKNAPTDNDSVLSFVSRVATLTTPDDIVWVDGSDEQKDMIDRRAQFSGPGRLTAVDVVQQNGSRRDDGK